MALVKAVPSDAVQVEVKNVDSAGSFWVMESSCTEHGWRKEKAQLDVLEMFLSCAKSIKRVKHCSPQINEMVAVQLKSGSWHRGRVLSTLGCKYKVFLIDHGKTVTVSINAIRDIDERLARQKPLVFCVQLFGVLPSRKNKKDYKHKQVVATEEWSQEANMFVEKLVNKSSMGYLVSKIVNESGHARFGDLYLVSEKGFLNLGMHLCLNNYALMDVQLFAKLNGLDCKTHPSRNILQAESSKPPMSMTNDQECHFQSSYEALLKSSPPDECTSSKISNFSSELSSSKMDLIGRKRNTQGLKGTTSRKNLIGNLVVDVEAERKMALKNVIAMCSSQLSNDSQISSVRDVSVQDDANKMYSNENYTARNSSCKPSLNDISDFSLNSVPSEYKVNESSKKEVTNRKKRWPVKHSENVSSSTDTESPRRDTLELLTTSYECKRKEHNFHKSNLSSDEESLGKRRNSNAIPRKVPQSPDYGSQQSKKKNKKYPHKGKNNLQINASENANKQSILSCDSLLEMDSNSNTGWKSCSLDGTSVKRALNRSSELLVHDITSQNNKCESIKEEFKFQRSELLDGEKKLEMQRNSEKNYCSPRISSHFPNNETHASFSNGNISSSGDALSAKKNQKSEPVLTFFPAGFNMAEADRVFVSQQSTKNTSVPRISENANCSKIGLENSHSKTKPSCRKKCSLTHKEQKLPCKSNSVLLSSERQDQNVKVQLSDSPDASKLDDMESKKVMQNESIFIDKNAKLTPVLCNMKEQDGVLSSKVSKDKKRLEEEVEESNDGSKYTETSNSRSSSKSHAKERLLSAFRDYISESCPYELSVNTLGMPELDQLIGKLASLTQKEVSDVQEGVTSRANTCNVSNTRRKDSSGIVIRKPVVKETCISSSTTDVTSGKAVSPIDGETPPTANTVLSPTVNVSSSSPADVTFSSPADVTFSSTSDANSSSTANVTFSSAADGTSSTLDDTFSSTADVTTTFTADITSSSIADVSTMSTAHITSSFADDVTSTFADNVTSSSTASVTSSFTAGVSTSSVLDDAHSRISYDSCTLTSQNSTFPNYLSQRRASNITLSIAEDACFGALSDGHTVEPDVHSVTTGDKNSTTFSDVHPVATDHNCHTKSDSANCITVDLVPVVSNDLSVAANDAQDTTPHISHDVTKGVCCLFSAESEVVQLSEQALSKKESNKEVPETVPPFPPKVPLIDNLENSKVDKDTTPGVCTETTMTPNIFAINSKDSTSTLHFTAEGRLNNKGGDMPFDNTEIEFQKKLTPSVHKDANIPEEDTNVPDRKMKNVCLIEDTTNLSLRDGLNEIQARSGEAADAIKDINVSEVLTQSCCTVAKDKLGSAIKVTKTANGDPENLLSKEISKKALNVIKPLLPQSVLKCEEKLEHSGKKELQRKKVKILDASLFNEKQKKHSLFEDDCKGKEDGKVMKAVKCRAINVDPYPGTNLTLDEGWKIMDQLQHSIVLLHGAPKGFRPLNVVADATFRRDIHEGLKTIMHRLMRMQKNAWPLIQQGHNLLMVGPSKCGKTLAYAVPLLDQVLQKVQSEQVPEGNGPVMLILCSGSESCNQIREICWKFLQKTEKDIKMIMAYGGGAEKVEFKLVNGCHILISTPRCFKRLLGKGKMVVNFLRLQYLVLDEADILTLRFLPEVEVICRSVQQEMKAQDKASLQVVAASEKWCPGLEGLAQILPNIVICIGDFLEALVYARLQPQLYFVTSENRLSFLCEIIQKTSAQHRTLIVCKEVNEVEEVWNALQPNENLVMAHEKMDIKNIHDYYAQWNWMEQSILVCTDVILREMNFEGTSQLVFYSLPDNSKTWFASCCSTLSEQLPQMFAEREKQGTHLFPAMHIFISDTDCRPLPTLVRFLKRVGASVDPDLQKRAKIAEMSKEILKDNVFLCYNTKAFGDCWNKSKCGFRHTISDRDKPRHIPTSGNVKVKIIHVHDACYFTARILEHVEENGRTVTIPNLFMSIDRKLRAYFLNKDNRVLLENPKAHDICAVEKPLMMYRRAEILQMGEKKDGKPTETLIRFIDVGGHAVVKSDRLFVLSEALMDIPPQTVELFLCRLIPCDLDWSWGAVTNQKVATILSETNEKETFIIGKIKLSLGYTLWLDPLECYKNLSTLKTSTIIYSLRRKLLDGHLAVENPQHLHLLHQMCVNAGFPMANSTPIDTTSCVEKPEGKVEPSWAHLPIDEFSLVYFVVGDHPGRFYVRLQKFEDLVHKLDKKLNRIANEKSTTDRMLFAGDYCIGRFPTDKRWYRAHIENAQEDTLDLFFVDHGDRASVSRSDVLPLPKHLASQLPCQAIECCFAGVGPDKGDRWSEKSTDALYDITAKPGTEDGVKLLYAKVLKKVKPADCTGGYKYHVALIEVTAHGQAVLNNTLVAWKLATQTEEQRQLLASLDCKDLIPPLENYIEDSEEDNVTDEGQIEEAHFLNTAEIIFGEATGSQNASLSENSNVNISNETCVEPTDKTNAEVHIEDGLADFNFNNVTEDEIMEFLEKTMEQYNSCKEKQSSITSELNNEKQELAAIGSSDHNLSICSSSTWEEEMHTCKKDENRRKGSLHGHKDGKTSNVNDTDSECDHSSSEVKNPMPHMVKTTRVPLVYWRQNPYFVWLRVELPGIKNYYLKWDIDMLKFWALVNDVIYTFDLQLFGSINPDTLTHSGGLYVHIKMQKLCVGMPWLRLVLSKEKLLWVKRDYSSEYDSDLEDIHLSEQLRAVKEMEKREEPRVERAGLLPADEVSYDSDGYDSNCSDVLTPDDELYDPYDPLN